MSSSSCSFQTCIQVSQQAGNVSGIPISLRIFQFVVIHTIKGFGLINKAEVDVFLELSCFFCDPVGICNLISRSSAFSKSSLSIWKLMVHVLLKPGLENFDHYFASVWDEQLCSSLNILWHCLSLGLEWKLTLSSPMTTAEFSKFAGILSATPLAASSFRIWNSSTRIPSPPLVLFLMMLPKVYPSVDT